MILTGRQIREARALLGWEPWRAARAAGLRVSDFVLAEAADDRCHGEMSNALAIRCALEAAGIEFASESDSKSDVRLRSV